MTRGDAATDRHGEEVIGWRQQQLLAAGFDAALATTLAANGCWDLHALLELVERGCPPQLAVRILSPLQETGDQKAGVQKTGVQTTGVQTTGASA